MLDPICVYKTPCGWCSKFDKECDRKIGHSQEKPIDIPLIYARCFGCINYPSETNGLCKKCNPRNGYAEFESIKENRE